MPNGYLDQAELMEQWRSLVDPAYSQPLLDKPDSGIEFIEQAAAQFEEVSRNINSTQQQMFIRPWSGQTGEPAGGARRATVVLTLERTRNLQAPLTLQGVAFSVEQLIEDYSKEGPIIVSTGRRYVAAETYTFAPGERGPVDVTFLAELPGGGYNKSLSGTIRGIGEGGQGLHNIQATVIPGTGTSHILQATERPDVPSPDAIGSYVEFTGGANLGRVARILGYLNPTPGLSGGSFVLAADGVYDVSNVIGTFRQNESVIQTTTGAIGTLLSQANGRAVIWRTSGTFVAGDPITGISSNATADLDAVDVSPDLVGETGSAAWTVFGYVTDFGLTATNAEQPTGGRSPFLDELGSERGVDRSSDESDSSYRDRVATPADVVSPNALLRVANAILQPIGLEACLREVGTAKLPGFFYDANQPNRPNAYDLETTTLGFAGASTGFTPGERVLQVQPDRYVYGTAITEYGADGQAGDLIGVVRVDGEFLSGYPVLGLLSGASATPTAVGVGLQARHRFITYFDLEHFRGFFMIGVPPIAAPPTNLGFFYDDSLLNAYDVPDISQNFYDNPVTVQEATSPIYQAIQDAINGAKAAGVPWTLYVERDGCV